MTVTAVHPEPDPYDREVLHLDHHPVPITHDRISFSIDPD